MCKELGEGDLPPTILNENHMAKEQKIYGALILMIITKFKEWLFFSTLYVVDCF